MRAILFGLILLSCSKAFSLYLLVSDGYVPDHAKKKAYTQVLLKDDYPMCLQEEKLPASIEEINEKLNAIHPGLSARWVPTSLFQLFVVECFFSHPEFQGFVHKLGYGSGFYDSNDLVEEINFKKAKSEKITSVNVDEGVVAVLNNPKASKQDLYAIYDAINQDETVTSYFLKCNDAFLAYYSDTLADDLLASIPHDMNEWKHNHFPFLYNNYSRDAHEDMKMLLRLFSKNSNLIKEVIAEETKAHKEGKHLIYRGAELVFFNSQDEEHVPLLLLPLYAKPARGEFSLDRDLSSYSHSYANSLFGGIFLSTDACAARYAETEDEFYAFHALKLDRTTLLDDPLFCIPPFHPFSEMLVEGEWFHPHARIARKEENQRCYGWFAKPNRHFTDHHGFIMKNETPEELGTKHLNLIANDAILMNLVPSNLPFDLNYHHKPIQQLSSFTH